VLIQKSRCFQLAEKQRTSYQTSWRLSESACPQSIALGGIVCCNLAMLGTSHDFETGRTLLSKPRSVFGECAMPGSQQCLQSSSPAAIWRCGMRTSWLIQKSTMSSLHITAGSSLASRSSSGHVRADQYCFSAANMYYSTNRVQKHVKLHPTDKTRVMHAIARIIRTVLTSRHETEV